MKVGAARNNRIKRQGKRIGKTAGGKWVTNKGCGRVGGGGHWGVLRRKNRKEKIDPDRLRLCGTKVRKRTEGLIRVLCQILPRRIQRAQKSSLFPSTVKSGSKYKTTIITEGKVGKLT